MDSCINKKLANKKLAHGHTNGKHLMAESIPPLPHPHAAVTPHFSFPVQAPADDAARHKSTSAPVAMQSCSATFHPRMAPAR
jgi:hypothetical protein